MSRYDMTTDPSTWPKPDDVDVIQAAERYEASDDYDADVRDWMATSDHVYNWAAVEYAFTDAYERGFRLWLDRQIP